MFSTELRTRKPALVDQDAIAYILMKNGSRSIYEDDELSLDDLSLLDRLRYAWIDYCKELRGRGYGVYHLTIAYNTAEYCPAYASKKKFHYDDFLIFGPKKLDA